MFLELFFQYLVAGLTYGTIYAIVGIGFNIIYNTTGIINFAQGEFVMLGGMTAVTLYGFLPLPLAVIGAVLITMVMGGLIEMVFIRWLVKPTVLRMIIITIGISILIEIIEKMIEISGKLGFCCLTPTIEKTFHIMGLAQYAPIFTDEESAVAQLRA